MKDESATQEQTGTGAIETRPKRKRGGQPGNQSGLKHGLYALQASKARRLRNRGQRIGAEIRDSLITDLGGEQSVSAQQRVLIELVAYDVAAFDQINRAIQRILKKRPAIKENPAGLWKLDSYLRPMMNSAAANVFKLGLEKRVKTLTLQELLMQGDDGEGEQGDAGGDPGGDEKSEPRNLS